MVTLAGLRHPTHGMVVMAKRFSLGEAETLLPVLEALVVRAQGAMSRSAELELEMETLNRRIVLSGGMHVDLRSAALRRAEREKAVQEASSAATEIGEIGAKIHDLDAGMLDIPFQREGEAMMLCWKVGERSIEYWHEETEEPVERRSLDGRFGRGERKRPN